MNFLLPIRTNPQTGKRELNGFFLLLVILAGGAFMYFGFFNKKTNIIAKTPDPAVAYTDMTDQAFTEEGDPATIKRRDAELAKIKESQSRSNPEELQKREAEVKEKYKQESENEAKLDARTNYEDRLRKFMETEPTPQALTHFQNTNDPAKDDYKGWVPFSIRKEKGMVKENGKQGAPTQGVAKTPEEEEKKKGPDNKPLSNEEQVVANYQESIDFDKAEGDQNFLPLGTYIPAVLLEDIITTDLQQYVTASVAQDVTFRRRLQLPKGAVMLRGRTAAEPVHNVADIHFDVMIFADGTELPCSGIACSALDVRYPDRFRSRGVPGTMVTPPLYIKAKALYYTAIAGGIESYMKDTETLSNSGSGDVTINVPEGTQNGYEFFSGRNPRYVERALLRGTADTLKVIQDDLQADMRKYRPYVKIEKGTAFFIQMEQTVNLNARSVNGLAKAQSRDRDLVRTTGMSDVDPRLVYPPGDARANYNPLLNPQGVSGNQMINPVTNSNSYPYNSLNSGNNPTGSNSGIEQQIQMQQLQLMRQAQEQMEQERLRRTNAVPVPTR
jgi:Bacterial conjugation TrbI-like protein